MANVRVAAIQMQSRVGKVEENITKMKKFIEYAAANKVEIICFPELSIQGYTLQNASSLAEPKEGSICKKLQKLSHKHNIIILAGLIEKSDYKDKPYISHLVIYPEGKIDKYRKTHLGVTEEKYFRPGHEVKCFSSEKIKFGIQLCFDTHFPEVTTIQALNGAELIFAPHATPMPLEKRKESWKKYLQARAYDNSVYFIACNHTGDNGNGINYYGGCIVFDPLGNIVAETHDEKENIIIVEIDQKLLNTIRNNSTNLMKNRFYLKSRRPEIYQDIIK